MDTFRHPPEKFLELIGRNAKVSPWEWDEQSGQFSTSLGFDLAFRAGAIDTRSDGLGFIPEANRPALVAALTQCAKTGDPIQVDCDLLNADGQIIKCRLRGERVTAPNGTSHVVGTLADITERALREEKLKELSQRFLLAKHAAKIGAWDWNLSDGEIALDDEMFALYGIEPHDRSISIEVWSEMLHPDDRDLVIAAIEDAFATRNRHGLRFRIVRPDESILHIQSSFLIQRNDEGEVERVFGIDWDVTQEAELRGQLLEKMDRAESISAAKSEYIATVSHEIRTPMNAVIGFCDLLEVSGLNSEQREFLSLIKAGGESILEIINAILDFSKIEAGKFQIAEDPFDLIEVVENTCSVLIPTARRRGLTLTLECDPDTPNAIVGDSFAVKRILTNLVGNAIKFTERGSVRVKMWATPGLDNDGVVRIEVRDTGVGLSPEILARLFQPFEQGRERVVVRSAGTGLGLSIARGMARAMGGDLDARPAPNSGSIFTLTLPFRKPEGVKVRPKKRVKSPSVTSAPEPLALHVLVAEDNLVNQRLTTLLLSRIGCTFELVENGLEALAALESRTFDVVLMDIQMPEMDGLTAVAEIRRRESAHPDAQPLPVVALTACAMADEIQAAEQAGMSGHLSKPITLARLWETLRAFRTRD